MSSCPAGSSIQDFLRTLYRKKGGLLSPPPPFCTRNLQQNCRRKYPCFIYLSLVAWDGIAALTATAYGRFAGSYHQRFFTISRHDLIVKA